MPVYPSLYDVPRNVFTAIGVPMVLGSLSGYMTASVVKGPWYTGMKAPAFRPPNRAFGIVWPTLYASMGYASHLIVKSYDSALTPATKSTADLALKLYFASLGLNYLWTPLFFGLKQTGLGLVDILALTGTVVTLTVKAAELPIQLPYNIPGGTTTLLAPYVAWLAFATYLNGGYWFLNFSPFAKKSDSSKPSIKTPPKKPEDRRDL